ncbi:MAG TPA: CU044_5270 family protein [Streptosporangiaceae bacterium]|nr:CU044_5270 family protein [Streptosporangiaceae bacterium]
MRPCNELDRLAAVRPRIVRETEDLVDAAEAERLLRQILVGTAAPRRARVWSPGRGPAPRRLAGLLAGGLGLTAAAVTAAVVLASGVTPVPGGPPGATHPGPGGRSAQQVLLTAAAIAAATQPDGHGSYWYVKQTWSQPGSHETDESWTRRYSGYEWLWAGKKTNGRVIKLPMPPVWGLVGDPAFFGQWLNGPPIKVRPQKLPSAGFRLPGQLTFGQLQKLPANPEALKARIIAINRAYERLPDPQYVAVFLSLTSLVAEFPVPPQVRAAAFRAMASLPNVTSLGPVNGGQGLRLSLGGSHYATLVVNTTTSQVSDILSVSGVAQGGGQRTITAQWVNRVPGAGARK